jgi:2-iminobutanoate/2-iminopropanoate deaminase
MNTLRFLILVPAMAVASAFASDIPKKPFHLNEKIEKDIGYAQAVRIGDTLYVSGSVGAGEMPTAMRQAYNELKQTLAAHGLDFKNVVKENLYTTDLDAVKAHIAVRKEYYGAECPAATWVQVQRLYLPKFVIEVELVAVFPKSE